MKTATALQSVSRLESLKDAWGAIKKNQRSKGVDNVTIKAFKSNLDVNLRDISKKLRENTYRFSKLRPATVAKAGSKKPRPIQIPTVKDRVVMKALALYIEPSFAKFDLPCSFAFIRGENRGVKAAVTTIKGLVDEGYVHYFEADIIKFFEAVDRSRLWKLFSKQVRHKSLLPLLQECFNLELNDLESYQLEHQDIFLGATEGIPQGGVLSPMLANFYLHHFDSELVSRGFKLVRYADDFVVMCKSRDEAAQAHLLCRETLDKLGLQIHALGAPNSKSRFGNFSKDGLSFLGIRFEGKITYPHAKVVERFKAKVTAVLRPSTGNSLARTLQSLANLITGWGRGYQDMRVMKTYEKLDAFIKQAVVQYLQHSNIVLSGRNRGKQMKLLGVPSLCSMVSHAQSTTAGKNTNRKP